jgi:hypothetical protein
MISSTLLPAISDGAFTFAGSAGVVAAWVGAPAADGAGVPAAGALVAGVEGGAAGVLRVNLESHKSFGYENANKMCTCKMTVVCRTH